MSAQLYRMKNTHYGNLDSGVASLLFIYFLWLYKESSVYPVVSSWILNRWTRTYLPTYWTLVLHWGFFPMDIDCHIIKNPCIPLGIRPFLIFPDLRLPSGHMDEDFILHVLENGSRRPPPYHRRTYMETYNGLKKPTAHGNHNNLKDLPYTLSKVNELTTTRPKQPGISFLSLNFLC